MKLEQFEAEKAIILSDVNLNEVYWSCEFTCELTNGIPICLCALLSKRKAWLDIDEFTAKKLTTEQLSEVRCKCAEFGIHECYDSEDFNYILMDLGEEYDSDARMIDDAEIARQRANDRWCCDDDCDYWWEKDDNDYF